ncbi:MAG: hypothetical protein U0M02_04740 [Acutalibacteraceae bacterium]|nr:hypothetical protein [Acutalibacteraceae bacterium]
MKKLLAILLAAAMLFALAACGDKTTGETTTTTAAEEITDAPVEESTDAPAADTSDVSAEEPSAEDPSTADPSTADPSAEETSAPAAAEMTKAEFVAFLNAETAKAAKGSYNYNRNCSYTSPIDVGGATDILNGIIKAIDENSSLDTVVGDFLGIGVKKGAMPKDELKGDYQIKATKLAEADLGNFKAENGVYTFTLANATNPKKTNATPISKFTNDFITHEEVVDGIAGFTTAITVKDTTVNYKDIKVTVTVTDGKISNIKYSYAFDAVLSLKAVVTINGNGAAVTKAEFSNIKY